MSMPSARIVLLSLLAAAAAALPAGAADPATGTLSNATPKTEWKGEAAGYGTSVLSDVNGAFVGPCQAPNCDSFAIDLKDAGDLTVTLTTNVGSFMTMEVEAPDGTITYNGGADEAASTTIKLKKAATGTYTVRAQTTNTLADDYGYTGFAILGAPPAPAPAKLPGTAPAPVSKPGAQITIRTRTGSARKVRKGLAIALSATSEVKTLVAELRKGNTVWARGTLAKLSGKGTVKIKGKRKLKPGNYAVYVRGTDAVSGAAVSTLVKFKLKR